MSTYDFQQQLLKGQQAETELDNYFGRYYDIDRHATRQEQRKGIDRAFYDRTGLIFVKYKADFAAHRTGNAFIETVSIDSLKRSGWAYSCQADCLAYYIPEMRLIYWIAVSRLKDALGRWERDCRKTFSQNKGYKTWGLLVPLGELEAIAHQVINL